MSACTNKHFQLAKDINGQVRKAYKHENKQNHEKKSFKKKTWGRTINKLRHVIQARVWFNFINEPIQQYTPTMNTKM